MTDHDIRVLAERIANLKETHEKSEAAVLDQLRTALESHLQLHMAHEKAHSDEHAQTQRAVERAEAMTVQIAHDHEQAHAREHVMTKEQADKADLAYEQRLGSMSRETAESFKRVIEDVALIKQELAGGRGLGRGVALVWAVAIAAIGVVIGVITFVSQWR